MRPMPTLDSLERSLEALLPQAKFEITPGAGLLTLVWNSIGVGFCIAENDVEAQYEASYEAFKKIFITREQTHLEPSFVLCVDSRYKDIEQLSSSKETDVYFCRKYVLPYDGDIEAMLSQLPFLPLDAIEAIGSRPETAQTFLQQKGAPAELARHIAVPARRGAAAIVDLCLSGHYGDFISIEGIGSGERLSNAAQDGADPVVVESVSIQGFRAYKKLATFNLGPKITFLYGPNGFGKTSFFDAFDFALTGGIGRLDTDSRGADLQALATHLDSDSKSASVSMVLKFGETSVRIERGVDDSKSAKIDGTKTDRKALLSRVTGADTPSADRIENLVGLFRATHLFSQEQQELTKEMHSKSELSADIVSRMLALDDYATSSTKLSAVVAEIEARVRTLKASGDQASARIAEIERDTSSLVVQVGDAHHVDMDALISSLVLQAIELGGTTSNQESPIGVLRALRASLEYVSAQNQAAQERLPTLRGRALSREHLVLQISTLAQQSSDLKVEIARLGGERLELETSLALLNDAISRGVHEESAFSRERSAITWTLANRQTYQASRESSRELEGMRPALMASATESSKSSQDALAELTFLEGALELQAQELSTAEARQIDAIHIVDQMAAFPAITRSLKDQRLDLARLQTDSAALASSISSADNAADEAASTASEVARRLAAQETSIGEMRSLIEQVKGHAQGSECPACGHDHGSQAALMESLSRFDESDPLAELRQVAREAGERSRETSKLAADLRETARSLDGSTRSCISRIEENQREMARLASLCSAVGITVSGDQELTGAVQAYLARCADEVVKVTKELSAIQHALEEKRSQLSVANDVSLEARAAHDANEARIDALRRDVAQIEQNPMFSSDGMSCQPEALQEKASEVDKGRSLLSSELASLRDSLASVRGSLVTLDEKTAEARTSEASIQQQLAQSELELASVSHDLAQAELVSGDPVASIDSALLRLTHERAAVRALLEKVKSAEVASDAATTAAALSAYRATLEQQKEVQARAHEQVVQYKPWLSLFRSLSEKVKNQREEAVAGFTTSYGPRTSVIQKRLRAVYGFEEVSITPVDSRILVSVTRHGKKLRPSDYFSQSQQQTLMLGLFLTACSSQTWSDFGPVLLDDPVAHFDDLNTYAFLDLVRGLLLDGGRQFVISTCDERFMQMAIRKFKVFGEGAKFYRFQSIGSEGPEVREM